MALDVNSAEFEKEVIEASKTTPILVDFWAEWCGPCRVLGPVLDKVEAGYGGRFKLVKVNTEHNQDIAASYRISSIPAVKLFMDGMAKADFVGNLPEQQVRNFLDQHLPNPLLEKARQAVQLMLQSAKIDWDVVAALLKDPSIPKEKIEMDIMGIIALAFATESSSDGFADKAKALVEALPLAGRFSLAREQMLSMLDKNVDLSFLGSVLAKGETEKSLQALIDELAEAAGEAKEAVKSKLVVSFSILGESPLVNEYRRKMSSLLFS